MEVISSEERFEKLAKTIPLLKKNFTVISQSDLDWLYNWAEFGITVYKIKKENGNDNLGEWRPSTDNRRIQEQEQQTGASCNGTSEGRAGNVLASDGLRSGAGMEGNMAEEKVRG